MRKGFVFLTGFLLTLALTYLFYHSCKRDTLVIAPADRVAIPDSSWLFGTINLEQTKKDIAWSTLLNADFNTLFQTDTNKNTLLKIVRTPDAYAITEQDNIRYFSIWKNNIPYTGLLFTVQNNAALKQSFKSDSLTINQKVTYSFRTAEGFWMYDANNLLFISGASDSLAACSFWAGHNKTEIAVSSSNDTLNFSSGQQALVSGHINTVFLPADIKHALLDSAYISFQVMRNDAMLDINWTYKGFLTAMLNRSSMVHQNSSAALYCFANLNVAGMEHTLNKIPALKQSYLKQKTTLDPFIKAVDNNNLTLEFNGWKKIKSSYYTSVLNEEFETVLLKKDSSIVEPIFRISLEQKNRQTALHFLSYLQKEGLVSKEKQQPFAVIYGNFDSEMRLTTDNTFVVQNKHTTDRAGTSEPTPLDAAFVITIHPASLKGLEDANIEKPELFQKFETYKQFKTAMLYIQKEQEQLKGSIQVTFAAREHPFISLMKVLKKSDP